MKNPYIVLGAVGIVVLGVIFFLKTTSGKAVGKEVAGVVTGFVGGIGSAVADVADDENINPLYGVGSWIGKTIYNWSAPASTASAGK